MEMNKTLFQAMPPEWRTRPLNQNRFDVPNNMKVALVWTTPNPEKTIAIAMRRCYSTRVIEEIESELDQKGPEYWKYLLGRALQDKSLDVIEHYCLELLLEGVSQEEMGRVLRFFPFVRALQLNEMDWLVAMNARTLIEMWRDSEFRSFAGLIVSELNTRGISPIFNSVAFGA